MNTIPERNEVSPEYKWDLSKLFADDACWVTYLAALENMNRFLADETLSEYQILLEKILRFKPHVLSESEEKLLAMQAEANQTPVKTFSALTNVDMSFGSIKTDKGDVPLTQSTFISFLIHPDRNIREQAYFQFYRGFEAHKNTLASLYAGSVHLDIYTARVRGYPSARTAALFPDRVDETVYDNLLETVGAYLPDLHKYYALRKKALGVDRLCHYDVHVPMVKDITAHHSYNEAVAVITKALKPLGPAYCNTLAQGLNGGWVDRYENRGKHSGAFSSGAYTSDPYILMNYKEAVLGDVFTIALSTKVLDGTAEDRDRFRPQ